MSRNNPRLQSAKAGKLRVLDLFSGCGGLSLGFHRAGFEVVAGVEIDPIASLSHALNFFKDASDSVREKHSHPIDITEREPRELIDDLQARSKRIDVIVGGPPCQSFARVGRAKLREVYEHPEAFKLDPRKDLYLRFLHYVLELKPKIVLMENVPDVMNSGGHNVPQETCEILADAGYECGYTLLNAAYYGVPEMRERMFLLAWSRDFGVPISFPEPSRWLQLPPGYIGTRSVALMPLRKRRELLLPGFAGDANEFYVEPPSSEPGLKAAVTAEEALRDLPPITIHLEGGMRRGARRFDEMAKYRQDVEPSEYGRLMRSWPGFEGADGVCDHVIRYLPRDYPIFKRMKPGDQYPQAYRVAERIFEEEVLKLRNAGKSLDKSVLAQLRKQIVPPYDATKFPNKWRKMEADKPARTIMAHISHDSYSHIHYDSRQARTISVREAARIQSFPDGFQFCGTMNPAFKQIGNAVPPLMSYAIADHILRVLKLAAQPESSRGRKKAAV